MSVNITLEEIIKRKIYYWSHDINEELFYMNKGYVRGFEEMLDDISMLENEFIKKYTGKINEVKKVFENSSQQEISIEVSDELSGYNNAIVDVLSLLNEQFLYDENV